MSNSSLSSTSSSLSQLERSPLPKLTPCKSRRVQRVTGLALQCNPRQGKAIGEGSFKRAYEVISDGSLNRGLVMVTDKATTPGSTDRDHKEMVQLRNALKPFGADSLIPNAVLMADDVMVLEKVVLYKEMNAPLQDTQRARAIFFDISVRPCLTKENILGSQLPIFCPHTAGPDLLQLKLIPTLHKALSNLRIDDQALIDLYNPDLNKTNQFTMGSQFLYLINKFSSDPKKNSVGHLFLHSTQHLSSYIQYLKTNNIDANTKEELPEQFKFWADRNLKIARELYHSLKGEVPDENYLWEFINFLSKNNYINTNLLWKSYHEDFIQIIESVLQALEDDDAVQNERFKEFLSTDRSLKILILQFMIGKIDATTFAKDLIQFRSSEKRLWLLDIFKDGATLCHAFNTLNQFICDLHQGNFGIRVSPPTSDDDEPEPKKLKQSNSDTLQNENNPPVSFALTPKRLDQL